MHLELPIKTSRLIIENFSEKHISPRYISWLNDPEVVKYSEQRHVKHDKESCINFFNSFKGGVNSFLALIADDQSLGHIGNITTTMNIPNGSVDIAILIGEKKVWGQGYGLEAWRAVMDAIIQMRKIRKITAGCMSENKAMLSIMEKSEMVYEYTKPKMFLLEGREVDSIHYATYL